MGWGVQPPVRLRFAANQEGKRESAAEYENEYFRSRRRVTFTVASATRGLRCDRPACWLCLGTVIGRRVCATSTSAGECARRHSLFGSPGNRRYPAGHRHGAESRGAELDRGDAGAARRTAGSADDSTVEQSRLGRGLLDLAQQPISVDVGALGDAAPQRCRLGPAALAAGRFLVALL